LCLQEVERAVFDLLLSAGADVNLQERKGLTPLQICVLAANRHKAQWLIGEAHHCMQHRDTDLQSMLGAKYVGVGLIVV
jgi:hypothetical protein